MRRQIFAFGRDPFWLDALGRAAAEPISLRTVLCTADLLDCMDGLPRSDPEALVLLDATMVSDVGEVIRRLRERGWRFVVAVAADPSAKQALAVLRKQLGYDYWAKTYEVSVIKADLYRCLEELESEFPGDGTSAPAVDPSANSDRDSDG